MNRSDFRQLAALRINEARVLLDNGCHQGAYYLAGYSVECALKACIAAKTQQFDFPPPDKFVRKVYTHNLETLVDASGLKLNLLEEENNSADFATNWAIVKDWSEEIRYNTNVSEAMASKFLLAITDEYHGVLQWLKKLW